MSRQKYVYNPKTLQFEEAKRTTKEVVLKLCGQLGLVVVFSSIIAYGLYLYIPSQKELQLEEELAYIKQEYKEASQNIEVISKVITNIKDRDEGVYRLMLGIDPIDPAVWEGGTGGRISINADHSFDTQQEIIDQTKSKIEKVERQIVLFSKSMDQIEKLAEDKSDRLASIPSIKPVRKDKLARDMILMSGYGMRMHPVHHIMKMHTGLDFTCPIGTSVSSTGNGKVVKVERKRSGYGLNVLIDHGYGYQTRYAHLNKVLVREGETVDKGQEIGKVGNSGTSTAPHLHYEVIHNGKHVDPLDFCLDGLTPKEYAELVHQANHATQSFD